MSEEKPSISQATDQGQGGIDNKEYSSATNYNTASNQSQAAGEPITDGLSALLDAGCSAEDAEKLINSLPSDLTAEEFTQAVSNILARGESLLPDNPAMDHLIQATNVEYEPPEWLIEPYFQLGAGTLIQGVPGIGKTAFVCALAALVTNGLEMWAVGCPERFKVTQGNVLMLSVEDDPGLLKGRFMASGGYPESLFFLDDAYNLSLSIPSDFQRLEDTVKQIDARLLILDPMQSFFSGLDFYKANQTRPVLARLFDMGKRNRCAVVLIAHTSKGARENSPVLRSLGSTDIPAACRSVLHIEKLDPESGELAAYHVKSNSAPQGKTIIYTIGEMGSANWERFTDDTLYQAEQSGRAQPERQECEQFLLETLTAAGNPIRSKELDSLADNAGFASATLRRAKSYLRSNGKIKYDPVTENGKRVYYTRLIDNGKE